MWFGFAVSTNFGKFLIWGSIILVTEWEIEIGFARAEKTANLVAPEEIRSESRVLTETERRRDFHSHEQNRGARTVLENDRDREPELAETGQRKRSLGFKPQQFNRTAQRKPVFHQLGWRCRVLLRWGNRGKQGRRKWRTEREEDAVQMLQFSKFVCCFSTL